MKGRLVAVCAALLATSLAARADEMADKYFSRDQNPKLTKQEREALAISQRWAANSASGMPPVPGPNGVIQFVYGAQQANLVCAVLNGCDVALQPGEVVNDIKITDQARWIVDPGLEGAGPASIVHLVIKPQDVGLTASLFVLTDRRRYYIRLRSHRTENMPMVAFKYPEDANARLSAVQQQQAQQRQQRQEQTLAHGGDYLGDLSFDYAIDGPEHLKPARVYNNGRKTVIEMPPSMANGELLALALVREEGGMFGDDKLDRINSRFHDGRYTVDAVFDKAILIAGVGRDQQRVTITRGRKK